MNYKNKTTYLFKIEITFQGAACAPLALLKKVSEGYVKKSVKRLYYKKY